MLHGPDLTGDAPLPASAGLSGETITIARSSLRSTEPLCHLGCKNPSSPFRGEREGPLAHRRCATRQAHARVRREGREGEVGLGNRAGFPHLTPALSAPGGGEGDGRGVRPGGRGDWLRG